MDQIQNVISHDIDFKSIPSLSRFMIPSKIIKHQHQCRIQSQLLQECRNGSKEVQKILILILTQPLLRQLEGTALSQIIFIGLREIESYQKTTSESAC